MKSPVYSRVVLKDSEDELDEDVSEEQQPRRYERPIHKPRRKKNFILYDLICAIKNVILMIPVLLVLAIIGLDTYSMLFVSVPNKIAEYPFYTTILGCLFAFDIILLTWSYLACVFTSSKVKDYKPPKNIDTIIFPQCGKCNDVKPDRAHHCSVCGHCVLKMDHHCPWVANCVGYYNHKYFVLFLFYTVMGCYIYLLNEIPTVLKVFGGHTSRKVFEKTYDTFGHEVPETLTLLAGILTFSFAIALTFFASFHIYMAFKNTTTLEVGDSGNVYDRGCYINFTWTFGTKPILWFLPVQTAQGTGYEFHPEFGFLREFDPTYRQIAEMTSSSKLEIV